MTVAFAVSEPIYTVLVSRTADDVAVEITLATVAEDAHAVVVEVASEPTEDVYPNSTSTR